jgi:hypothetical protein
MKTSVAAFVLMGLACSAAPADLAAGRWVRTDAGGKGMEMTVEPTRSGSRWTYWNQGKQPFAVVETPLDGTDAPVTMFGKPSGMTMGIKKLDARHYEAVLKFQGKAYGTSKGEVSADGSELRAEVEISADLAGQKVGKVTEVWKKK